MNNMLLMSNYLSLLKSNVEVYVHGTLESTNKKNRMMLKEGLDLTMNSQADTYDMMVNNNWYKINNIKCSDIKKVFDKVKDK